VSNHLERKKEEGRRKRGEGRGEKEAKVV